MQLCIWWCAKIQNTWYFGSFVNAKLLFVSVKRPLLHYIEVAGPYFWTIFENEDLQYTFTEHYDQNVRVPGVLLLRQLLRKCFVQKFQMSLTSMSKEKDEMNNIKWIIRLALLEYWNEIFKTFQLFKNSSKSKKVKKKLKTIF